MCDVKSFDSKRNLTRDLEKMVINSGVVMISSFIQEKRGRDEISFKSSLNLSLYLVSQEIRHVK